MKSSKAKRIMRAVGGIDDNYIAEATPTDKSTVPVVRFAPWLRWAMPVTACLVIAIGIFAWRYSQFIPNDGNSGDSILSTSNDNTPANYNPVAPPHGVDIPKIELPQNTLGVEMDMIGLFVYQGRIYTQAAWYRGDEAVAAISGLIGEKVGYATGNINEWSTQDEYAAEFAGSVVGDVYTVKGYEPQYRLCMTGSYTDDDGSIIQWVNFYEWLNGYQLTNGCNLFVFDSLMEINGGEIISKNWSHTKCQDHENWNHAPENEYVYRDLSDISDDDVASFLYNVYVGIFEDVHETFSEGDFYKTERRAHLYVYMNDNTVIELQLFEGGYVGYRHLGWYFVKIPGEAFDRVFNACM